MADSSSQTAQTIETNSAEPSKLYDYVWKVTSTTVHRNSFGEWRTGPTGLGPGTLNINESTTLSRSFTNTISGDFTIGKSKIATALGVTIGIAETHGTSYSITLKENERKTIIVRPKIKTYKVVSTYYKIPVEVIDDPVALKTETAYVDVFNGWDYSWRSGY